jgi:arabinose-5-phosphate isomerase
MNDIEYGQEVLRLEAAAVAGLAQHLDERFGEAVELILACNGQVIATGMGKSGLIGRKISATLASTGTPSIFLHPAEAIHGDLGRVRPEDLVIAISNSGAAEEILRLVPSVKRIGARLVSITARADSPLAQHADCVLTIGDAPEACPVGLAPTTSTTAQLAIGDALAMTVAKRRNFTREEYAAYHPGGALGRSLLTVADVMADNDAKAAAVKGKTAREALIEAGGLGRRAGALPVVGPRGNLRGLLTDGDIRRLVLRDPDFLDRPIEEVMTTEPTTVRPDQLAAEAWRIMRERKYAYLPVAEAGGRYVGFLDFQDLLKAGFSDQ